MDEYALCNPAYSTVINYEIFLHLSNLLNDIFILTYHMSLYLAICWSSWLLLVNSTIVLLEIWSWVYQVYPDQCDKQYIGKAGQKSLMRHIKISHMGLLFPCDECSYKSSTKSHLNRHKNALHKMKKQELDRWFSNITSASIIKL